MSDDNALGKLRACKYLYLNQYCEAPESMDFTIYVKEGRAASELTKIGDPVLDKAIGESYAVTIEPGYNAFKLIFENYIAFSIANESFAIPEENEDFSSLFRVYNNSSFLDYLSKATFSAQYFDEPIKHYQIVCCDHVINIVCQNEPSVFCRKVEADEII